MIKYYNCFVAGSAEVLRMLNIHEKMSFLSSPEPGVVVQCDLHLDTQIYADVGVQHDLYPNVLKIDPTWPKLVVDLFVKILFFNV